MSEFFKEAENLFNIIQDTNNIKLIDELKAELNKLDYNIENITIDLINSYESFCDFINNEF